LLRHKEDKQKIEAELIKMPNYSFCVSCKESVKASSFDYKKGVCKKCAKHIIEVE